MKLPFSFGTKLVFRILLPGSILAIIFLPLIEFVLCWCHIVVDIWYIFPVAVAIWGWIVLLADMHIYMIFEGRRFFPKALWRWLQRREAARLGRLLAIDKAGPGEGDLVQERRYLEAEAELANFPLDRETSESKAMFPTRLGNLIAAFEQYPRMKYGLSGVFFWYRLWVSIDKDLREEIDNQQALADGALYVVFCLYVAGFVALLYSVTQIFCLNFSSLLPGWQQDLIIGIVCWLVAFALYRLSLPVHAQFGELFKSLFDQWRDKLALDDVSELVRAQTTPAMVQAGSPLSRRERNIAVWRFLKWHMIRRPGKTENELVKLP